MKGLVCKSKVEKISLMDIDFRSINFAAKFLAVFVNYFTSKV